MKKKLLSIVVSICFILPCAIMLAACGANPNNPHTHVYDEAWTKNETHHWHKCKGCDEIKEKAEHNWDDGEITTPASPTTDGVKTYTCEDCEATKTEPVEYVPRATVTDDEWTDALAFHLIANYQMEALMGDSEMVVVKNGDKIKVYVPGQEDFAEYYVKDNDKYYKYYIDSEEYKVEETTKESFDAYANIFTGVDINFADFEYQADEKLYFIEQLGGMTNVNFYFEDGVLVKGTGEMSGTNVVYTFEYENIEVNLPEVAGE